ncbi:hypothetical protein ACP8HI_21860 [Paenibacillus sp. FA6]|uniref:hypothetical protein n=1 Tax=Paenibacillus sp. FA6 TaxID=3413029 RepID=UPI003F659251
MKGMKRYWASVFKKGEFARDEVHGELYRDIAEALIRWEEARMYFEEAVGKDQVDYAIYMLEAAELRYQIHLKKAKTLGIDRRPFSVEKQMVGSIVDHSV